MSEEKKCIKCSVILNEGNKVKKHNKCRSCNSIQCKEYKMKNKQLISDYNKIYKEKYKEDISKYNQKYHIDNKEVIQKRHNKNDVERRKNDPLFKLAHTCRTRINKAIKGNGIKSLKLIDCSTIFLKEWLEFNFDKEMNFNNHGSYWHIDHVIPCTVFNLENDDEIKHCFRWTNLQPLEAQKNLIKNNKINKKEVIDHYKKVKKFATLKNIKLEDFEYNKYF